MVAAGGWLRRKRERYHPDEDLQLLDKAQAARRGTPTLDRGRTEEKTANASWGIKLSL